MKFIFNKKYIHQLALPLVALCPGLAIAGAEDDPLLTMVNVNQLEQRFSAGEQFSVLDAQAWIGKDLNKLWFKTEAEMADGFTEAAEVQALYSKAVAPYWDLQVGVKADLRPSPKRNWGVIGVQGLAPYWFEIDAAIFIGDQGRSAARLNLEYELMLTQRLVLSPELEINAFSQSDEEVGVGAGLSNAEFGLRLRYEIRREFAPYVGVNWSKKFGQSADFARAEGGTTNDTQWVLGLRAWF